MPVPPPAMKLVHGVAESESRHNRIAGHTTPKVSKSSKLKGQGQSQEGRHTNIPVHVGAVIAPNAPAVHSTEDVPYHPAAEQVSVQLDPLFTDEEEQLLV